MAETKPTVESAVKISMFIQGAMIASILLFLGVTLILRAQNAGPVAQEPSNQRLISYIAAGYGLLTLVLTIALLPIFEANLRKKETRQATTDGLKLAIARALVTRNLLVTAFLEGAALFNVVAFLLEGRPLSLGVTGVLVLTMAFLFTTPDRAGRWIERQTRLVEQDSDFSV